MGKACLKDSCTSLLQCLQGLWHKWVLKSSYKKYRFTAFLPFENRSCPCPRKNSPFYQGHLILTLVLSVLASTTISTCHNIPVTLYASRTCENVPGWRPQGWLKRRDGKWRNGIGTGETGNGKMNNIMIKTPRSHTER